MRVGMRLAENMTDAQLDEFEGYIDRNDEPGALKWLETNFPNYKDVVSQELDKLKNEVQAAAPQILAAAQAQGNTAQNPAAPPPSASPDPGQAAYAPTSQPAYSQPPAPEPYAPPSQPYPPAAPTPSPLPPQPGTPPVQPPVEPPVPPQPTPPPYQQPYQPPTQPDGGQTAPPDPA
jgi:hypothetical protein